MPTFTTAMALFIIFHSTQHALALPHPHSPNDLATRQTPSLNPEEAITLTPFPAPGCQIGSADFQFFPLAADPSTRHLNQQCHPVRTNEAAYAKSILFSRKLINAEHIDTGYSLRQHGAPGACLSDDDITDIKFAAAAPSVTAGDCDLAVQIGDVWCVDLQQEASIFWW